MLLVVRSFFWKSFLGVVCGAFVDLGWFDDLSMSERANLVAGSFKGLPFRAFSVIDGPQKLRETWQEELDQLLAAIDARDHSEQQKGMRSKMRWLQALNAARA